MAALDFIFAGDLVLDEPRPDYWLSGIAPLTAAANIAIGHLEVPHTSRCVESRGDVPAPGADPANLAALKRAGFDAVTLAGNHIADCGALGIADTRAELTRLGIEHTGAGLNLESSAATGAHALRAARRIAVLSYNCVGPQSSWAAGTSGVAPTCRSYRPMAAEISPTAPLHVARAQRLWLACKVTSLRPAADNGFVIVALHKGLVHTPARFAPYERPVACAAIEAGAQVVIGHHAHIDPRHGNLPR